MKSQADICKNCKAFCCKLGGGDFTEKEMLKVLKAGYKNYFSKIGENHYELKSKKGICPYLKKDYSCRIYKVRPIMCKCWPVFINVKKNKKEHIIVQCPLTSALTKEQIKAMKKQANKIDTSMISGIYVNSNLPNSDLKLIEKRYDSFKKRKLKL